MTTGRIALSALLVADDDTAIAFFTQALRFSLVEDTDPGGGKRWVVVAPPGGQGGALLLARAVNDRQRAPVGDQFGGRVGLFLHTDDFAAQHAHMLAHGVRFAEAPRREPCGTVAVFQDLVGNRWDLFQPLPAG